MGVGLRCMRRLLFNSEWRLHLICPRGNQLLSRIFVGIGKFSVRMRWPVLAFWIVGGICVMVALPSISSVAKNDNSKFIPASDPSQKASAMENAFGNGSFQLTTLVVSDQNGISQQQQIALTTASQAIKKLQGVVDVKNGAISPSGQAETLLIQTNLTGFGNSDMDKFVKGARATFPALKNSGMTAHLAGAIPINVDSQSSSTKQGNQTQLLSIIFIVLLLGMIFRSVLAPLLTVFPAIWALLVASPIIGQSAKWGVQVSGFTQIILIVLILGAGTDYGLFLVFRVREEMRGGLDSKEAVAHGLAKVGESISFSAGTVIVALLSLLFASFGIYQSLGIPLAIGIAVMLLAGLTLLPALLSLTGRAAFWPSKVKVGTYKKGAWGRIAAHVVRKPVATLVIGIVLFGGLAVLGLQFKSSGFSGGATSPKGTDSAIGAATLKQYFPKQAANPTSVVFKFADPVWSDSVPILKAEVSLQRSGQFTTITGPLDATGVALTTSEFKRLYSELGPADKLNPIPPQGSIIPLGLYRQYAASSNFVSPDGRTIRFQTNLSAGDPTTTQAMNAVPQIRAAVSLAGAASGSIESGVIGEAPIAYDIASTSSSDLKTVIPIAAAFIAVLLALVMRSLVAPLYLIVSVVLSYFAALGLAVLIFMDLGGNAGLTFILPFLMFVFLLALGEDYNILVMTRIREESHKMPLKEAISAALEATGSTVTSAGLVLAGTFLVLTITSGSGAQASQFQAIGTGLGLGVLMDSFLVRTLLVPSLVAILGRWNWWPSSLHQDAPAEGQSDGEPDKELILG